MRRAPKLTIITAVVLGAVALDQAFKAGAESAVIHVPLIPLGLSLVAGLAATAALWALSTLRRELLWPSAALTAGLLGNLIDRVTPGRDGVLDHWTLEFPAIQATLILNFADTLLFAGLLGLVLLTLARDSSATFKR